MVVQYMWYVIEFRVLAGKPAVKCHTEFFFNVLLGHSPLFLLQTKAHFNQQCVILTSFQLRLTYTG